MQLILPKIKRASFFREIKLTIINIRLLEIGKIWRKKQLNRNLNRSETKKIWLRFWKEMLNDGL